MKRTLLLLSAALCLTACSAIKPPAPDVVMSYERVPVELTQDCPVEPPPTPETFLATPRGAERDKLLMDVIKAEIKNLSDCNVTKRNLRDWDQKQYDLQKSYQSKPAIVGRLSNVGNGTARNS